MIAGRVLLLIKQHDFFLKLWLQTNQLVEQKKFLICKLSVNVQHWFAKQSFYQFQTSMIHNMRFGHWKGHQRLFFVFLKSSLKFSIMIWIARSEIFFLFSFPFTPRLIPHRQDFSAGSPPCIVGDAHSRGSRGQCRSLQQLLPQCRSSPSPDPGARREEPVGRWHREPGASPEHLG